MTTASSVSLGIDHLIATGHVSGQRVGLVCNSASIDATFHHTADRLREEPDIALTTLFSPQHGFWSDVQDNMIETPHSTHPHYDIPIYSLYSDNREPTAEMLHKIDTLVIDLQDVGTRVYTYIYTMANCLRAARRQNIPIVVCDRPNPIGGDLVEGPMLKPGYESFVGQFPIPLRHGLTIGELARLFNDHFGIGAKLEVLPVGNWTRTMYQDQTGLAWVMPSPNLPTLDSALVYPGTVLFEGTNLSEGRGTTRPFELFGAPWVDIKTLTSTLNQATLPGVFIRPEVFEPTFQKHAGQRCCGGQIHVTNRQSFRPVMTAVTLLAAIRGIAPSQFAWREPPYEYELVRQPIDILTGSSTLREQIEEGVPIPEILTGWQAAVNKFGVIRRHFLMY